MSTRPNEEEYEALNQDAEEPSSPDDAELKNKPSSVITPLVFWTLCGMVLLTVLNSTLFPLTVLKTASHYNWKNLHFVDSTPGLEEVREKQNLTTYMYSQPSRISQVSAYEHTRKVVTFDEGRTVLVNPHVNSVLQFAVPDGYSPTCSLAFYRPPITVTSELFGALKDVEVWEVPEAALATHGPRIEYADAEEALLVMLDLTKQTQLMTTREFPCKGREQMAFEIRCPKEAGCSIQYAATIAPNSRIGKRFPGDASSKTSGLSLLRQASNCAECEPEWGCLWVLIFGVSCCSFDSSM
ncbi:hypothetical protein BC834DRAFT_913321 [Gloeopeniophorella convolvens]|nr:hypothetical protein BC834DRAFT_913321 [Gloeopeniophorella convolvens]